MVKRKRGQAEILLSLNSEKGLNDRSHGPSKISFWTSGLWLDRSSKCRLVAPPRQPILGSDKPKKTLPILDVMVAPAHIGQGSLVTYN